jgi:hypothetical protein
LASSLARFRTTKSKGSNLSKGKLGLAALFAAVLVAIVAGCGGGGSSSSSSGDTSGGEEAALTKKQFIAKADGICKAKDTELNEEVEKYVEEEGLSESKKPSKAQEITLVEKYVVPNIKQQGEEIGELSAPEGDEEQIEKIVTSLEEGANEAEEDPESIVGGNSTNPFETATKEAQAYGMKVCGSE